MNNNLDIIIKPLITEKTLRDVDRSWFTFQVARFATKGQIAAQIASQFSVKVLDVRVINMTGKTKKVGKKQIKKKRSNWKKAMVRLAKGQSIGLFQISDTPTDKTK